MRFADAHREFQNVKLSVQLGNSAWAGIWQSLAAQQQGSDFSAEDQLTLVVAERNATSEALLGLCERASSSVDMAELRRRLTQVQSSALDSIVTLLVSETEAFEVLRRTRVVHLAVEDIEQHLARRRLSGTQSPPPALLPLLRDMAGGDARKRGLFHAGSLRRRLKIEHAISLGEPIEWGLAAYRTMIQQLSRIEVPGLGISGSVDELFVWPRAQLYDRDRQSGFEDEAPDLTSRQEAATLDLRAFPNEELHRVVVVAGPGYGKSALLTALANDLAKSPIVPVHVPLASLASADTSIISFLNSNISQEMDLSADWQVLAEQGLLALLFDGLDEVPSVARPPLMQRISTFSARYPRASWVLTVRDAGVVTGLPEAAVVELLSLGDEDIERFATAMQSYLGDMQSWILVNRLNLYPDLDRLSRIPLFLVMLLATTDLGSTTALRRSDLIESYLKTLFSPGHHKTVPDPIDRSEALRQIAEILAFERLERQEIGATEREVRDVVARVANSADEMAKLYEQLIANGILKRQSAIRLQFPYPIVQEYLAACHLVDQFPESLEQRIDDAIQRPWAQVIQFALELHPAPEPIIRSMLVRPDDAFCTGLRLVGRCIANGAAVGADVRNEVGDRLAGFWVQAPSRARERVGRLLADGFTDPPTQALRDVLHHRWLIEDGAGDIISKLGEAELTLGVLSSLLEEDRDSFMIWHSLKPALRAAGDAAARVIIDAMDPDSCEAEKLVKISRAFSNFTPPSVSRDLALSVARDDRLPLQARMRAYELAGRPLEDEGVEMALAGLRHDDWDGHYAAASLVGIHEHPARFLAELIQDVNIPLKRRCDLAASVLVTIPDVACREEFFRQNIGDPALDTNISITLRLFAARLGNQQIFKDLIEEIEVLPIELAATTISLFGHFPDRSLSERAAELMRRRDMLPDDIARVASSVNTGMRYVYEMDFGFGGALRSAPPHPGIGAWRDLLEDWAGRAGFSPLARLSVLTATSEIGSEIVAAELEQEVLAISNLDDQEWRADDDSEHTLSSAIRQIQKRKPILPLAFIERILGSSHYNIAARGIDALQAQGDEAALRRLIDLHTNFGDWHLRDLAANTIELMAARQQVAVFKDEGRYTMTHYTAENGPLS
ncbi:MAG TPA: NACHT domain-containing protein [Devosia sp.]|nr:NACHT domain-containing protein [Devosia sp.]